MKTKTYRTVWVVVDDWMQLQQVAEVSGVSASAMVSQVVSVLVERLDGAGILEAVGRGVGEQKVREMIAQVMQEMAGSG